MDITNSIEALKQISKQVEKLAKLNDSTLSKLPPEIKAKTAPLQAKMNQAMKAMRNGDSGEIEKIIQDLKKQDASINK